MRRSQTSSLSFGVDVPTSAEPGRDPIAGAARAEALGYDFISANDHPCGSHASYETWTMLSWIAANTSRIKIATRVLGVPYRSPAMVAKMAESFDRLSEGRLILGMGGGGSDDEFRAFGLTVPSPRHKVEGLEEAVTIIRGLWTSSPFTFEGGRHRTQGADIQPKPSHQIPIWLGTFGKKALAVTGRVADGWIPSLDMAPPEDIPHMREVIFDAALGAGRDPYSITLAYNLEFRLGGAASPPHVISGSANEVTDRLLGLTALGFSAFNFIPAGPQPAEQIERLAHEVLPALREPASSDI